jgi:phosphoglycolate phosphatase/putative hydrolase of the HAD superfamily
MPLVHGPLDWERYRTVVFDVDGTLYSQRRMHLRMLVQILMECARTGDAGFALTLRAFRRHRADLGMAGAPEFLSQQYELTARSRRRSPQEVRRTVAEWIERRPLPFLAACMYPGVDRLFRALRASGRTIGILSDYPAREKIAAMGLAADIVVTATDPEVGRLKPDPRGLDHILKETATPAPACLMIGDRVFEDGGAASRCGVRALIRSARVHPHYDTFRSYEDAIFRPLIDQAPQPGRAGVSDGPAPPIDLRTPSGQCRSGEIRSNLFSLDPPLRSLNSLARTSFRSGE